MEKNNLEQLTFHPFANPKKLEYAVDHEKDRLISVELPNTLSKELGRLYLGSFPSVTTVLNKTKPEGSLVNLEQWQKKEIKKVGKGNFDLMMKSSLDNGTNLHKVKSGLHQQGQIL